MDKALVTGGAGFIGSNLVRELLDRDITVKVLDDFYLGSRHNLPKNSNLEVIEGSVCDKEKVEESIKNVDTVFHNAARSSAPMHKDNPLEGVDVNIKGFVNVAETALKSEVDKLVYASTSSMYGSVNPPHREDMGERPVNRYSASKMARELYADVYSKKGLDVTGLRYFSVYGPREKEKGRYANVVSQFIWKVISNERPKLFGDGEQKRDFTFVEDIVRGSILAAKKGKTGEYYNLGTGQAISFNKVIRLMEEQIGESIEVQYVDNPIKNYVRCTEADTSKAEKDLGYKPQYTFKEGLNKTLNFYTSSQDFER